MPSNIPPTGRMKKPTPKVAVVSRSEAYWLSLGQNNRAMITVKKPKTMKSYHSRAFPITAAAICKGFGVIRELDMSVALLRKRDGWRLFKTTGALKERTARSRNPITADSSVGLRYVPLVALF